eukprot:scaffold25274_cov66-Attheya_sp.AAC.2
MSNHFLHLHRLRYNVCTGNRSLLASAMQKIPANSLWWGCDRGAVIKWASMAEWKRLGNARRMFAVVMSFCHVHWLGSGGGSGVSMGSSSSMVSGMGSDV